MTDEPIRDDQVLVRYLLGLLPEDQAERLDELSVADGDFTWQLRSAENGLVDAYVRNELSGENLERFRSFYLSSALRREKVVLAETLLTLKRAPSPASWFTQSMLIPRGALAAAFAAILVLAALFVYQSTREPKPENAKKEDTKQPQLSRSPEAVPVVPSVALILPPPVRGAGNFPELTVPPDVINAVFELQLENDESPSYTVVLKGSADRILWRSSALLSHPTAPRHTVSITLPANILQSGIYLLELYGEGKNGALIADYAFRVVPK